MVWTIDYADTAQAQLKKLDRQVARRIIDYMGERISPLDDPRSLGKSLAGPLGGLWRYRIGDIQDGELCVLVVLVGNRREVYR